MCNGFAIGWFWNLFFTEGGYYFIIQLTITLVFIFSRKTFLLWKLWLPWQRQSQQLMRLLAQIRMGFCTDRKNIMMSQDIALIHQLAATVLRRHTRAVPRKVARSETPRAVVCPPRFHHYHWSSLDSHCCVDSARITDNNQYQKQSSEGPAHLAKSRSLNTHLRKQQHKCCYVSPPFPIRLAIQAQIQQRRLQRHNIPTSYGHWFGSSDLDNELATM